MANNTYPCDFDTFEIDKSFTTWWNLAGFPINTKLIVVDHITAAAINYVHAAQDMITCAIADPINTLQIKNSVVELLWYYLHGMRVVIRSTNDCRTLPKHQRMRRCVNLLEITLRILNWLQPDPDIENTSPPNRHILELLLQAKCLTTNPRPQTIAELRVMMATLRVSSLWVGRPSDDIWNTGFPFTAFVCLGHDQLVVGTSLPYWLPLTNFNKAQKAWRTKRMRPGSDRYTNLERCGTQCYTTFTRFTELQKGFDVIKRCKDQQNSHLVSNEEWNYVAHQAFGRLQAEAPNNNMPGFTFDHSQELGRAFHASTVQMFQPFSRCWKCRLCFNYKVNDGVADDEAPASTRFTANKSFVCAEDLAHILCGNYTPQTQTPGPSNRILPYPNDPIAYPDAPLT